MTAARFIAGALIVGGSAWLIRSMVRGGLGVEKKTGTLDLRECVTAKGEVAAGFNNHGHKAFNTQGAQPNHPQTMEVVERIAKYPSGFSTLTDSDTPDGHYHTYSISREDLEKLRKGLTVEVQTEETRDPEAAGVSDHTHTVRFRCVRTGGKLQ